MQVSIIAIGDELLIGQVTDTNSGWIARHLNPLGWAVTSVRVVPDDAAAISKAIREALAESPIVLTTGGLGPTKDDITKATLLQIFGGELRHDSEVEANVERVMAARHVAMNELTAQQAMVPSSCRVIQNRVGTAPIMWFERDGRVLVSLPGVPFETETMMAEAVIPQLLQRFQPDIAIEHRTSIAIDVSESALAERLASFESQLPPFLHLAYLPQPGIVRLRLTGQHPDAASLRTAIDSQQQRLNTIVGDNLIATADIPPAAILGDHLARRGLTIATAESCTGGDIAHLITSIAGSSSYYTGSVVSYSNDVKTKVLGVNPDDLSRDGAVSEIVVRQMAQGVARTLSTDCAIATSGIAGPSGGTPDKPVGTVWIAALCRDTIATRLLHLPGDRRRVIDRASTEAIKLMLRTLRQTSPLEG